MSKDIRSATDALLDELNRVKKIVKDIEIWAAVNEIAPVPLDWEGLGRILARIDEKPEGFARGGVLPDLRQ